MSAGAWQVYGKAKKYIGNGTITLGSGIFKMLLYRTSASATVTSVSTISVYSQLNVAELSTVNGYTQGGRTIGPATGKWTMSGAVTVKFTYTTSGVVFTASGGALTNVRYAVIRNSTGAGAGKVLCYCALSTAQFTVSSGNTLTIKPNSAGVFTLA